MKFEQYKQIKASALAACTAAGLEYGEPKQLNPIILAYIGDVVFSLYVRLRLVPTSGQVRVIHDLGSKMVSAVMQAQAMEKILPNLSDEEAYIAKRGRNTKSTVPKSASVHEYRMGTAFETLLGWLFLSDKEERLIEVLEKSFEIIAESMQNKR